VTVLGKGTMKRTDFTFEGWSVSPGSSSPSYAEGDTFTITADVDLYPVWTRISGGSTQIYYIYTKTDGGAFIDPLDAVSVREGGSVSFSYYAKPGSEITSVIIDGIAHPELLGAGSYTFYDVRQDHTIVITSVDVGTIVPVVHSGGKWSPINLILAVIALIAGIIGVIAGRGRKAEGEEGRRSKIAVFLRVLSLIAGIAAVILFLLTEDWTQPVAAVDNWTSLTFILFVVSMVVMLVSFRFDDVEG
jgi:uncharacterized membrane protein